MAPMLDDRYPVGTVEGHIEVTPLFSILRAEIGQTPILVTGGSLCNSLITKLQVPTRFGSSAYPALTGRAKLTGHYFETAWDTFPVVMLDVTAYSFVDAETRKEVVVDCPLTDKIEMELFYNDGHTQVVRLPDETTPSITIDLQTLYSLHKLVNRLPIPTEFDPNELSPPAVRLQSRINGLWEKFSHGLAMHGLWDESSGDPANK